MTAHVGALAGRLKELRLTVATAESCTGGLLAATLTAVPGASAWFRGGLVVYSNDLKIQLAGVRPATLESDGAVSPAVARELAQGARNSCSADVGIGITGIAGPGGGSGDKPVGTVCLAVAAKNGVHDWTVRFEGDRETVRSGTVLFALERTLEQLAVDSGEAH